MTVHSSLLLFTLHSSHVSNAVAKTSVGVGIHQLFLKFMSAAKSHATMQERED